MKGKQKLYFNYYVFVIYVQHRQSKVSVMNFIIFLNAHFLNSEKGNLNSSTM